MCSVEPPTLTPPPPRCNDQQQQQRHSAAACVLLSSGSCCSGADWELSVPRCIHPCLATCRIQGRALQGSQEQPHRAAVDQDLVKDLVEGQVSLAAALRQARNLLTLSCPRCPITVAIVNAAISLHDIQSACSTVPMHLLNACLVCHMSSNSSGAELKATSPHQSPPRPSTLPFGP